jgi:hypothetical protein
MRLAALIILCCSANVLASEESAASDAGGLRGCCADSRRLDADAMAIHVDSESAENEPSRCTNCPTTGGRCCGQGVWCQCDTPAADQAAISRVGSWRVREPLGHSAGHPGPDPVTAALTSPFADPSRLCIPPPDAPAIRSTILLI